jgi:hypothetical protein
VNGGNPDSSKPTGAIEIEASDAPIGTTKAPIGATPTPVGATQGPVASKEAEDVDRAPSASVGVIATPLRWLTSSAVFMGATLAVLRGLAVWSRWSGANSVPSPGGSSLPLAVAAIACAAQALLVMALLRAEESRLSRELRTARQATPLLRAMVLRRRQRGPLFARLLSSQLGSAAVHLAEGDESAARDMLAAELPWMHVGRLGALRAIVIADADRASGTPAARSLCIQRLKAARPIGNREADLYRVHVLVKAILEQGEPEDAFEIASRLVRSGDDEELIYATWLRVWFELDSEEGSEWPLLAEQQARRATLLARSHGAEALVGKLEARLLAIARTTPHG